MNEPNPIAIKEIRKLRGMSQRELGKRIGVSSGYVSRMERGDLKPRQKKCDLIAAALEVDVRALLTGSPA